MDELLERFAPLLVLQWQLKHQMLGWDICWILPPEVLPGVTRAFGVPVVRADVPTMMVGVVPPI